MKVKKIKWLLSIQEFRGIFLKHFLYFYGSSLLFTVNVAKCASLILQTACIFYTFISHGPFRCFKPIFYYLPSVQNSVCFGIVTVFRITTVWCKTLFITCNITANSSSTYKISNISIMCTLLVTTLDMVGHLCFLHPFHNFPHNQTHQ